MQKKILGIKDERNSFTSSFMWSHTKTQIHYKSWMEIEGGTFSMTLLVFKKLNFSTFCVAHNFYA